jgi:hypothetical protein
MHPETAMTTAQTRISATSPSGLADASALTIIVVIGILPL